MVTNSYDSKITKISKHSQQNNSKTVTNEHDREIAKERYISLEERQKITRNQKIIQYYNNGISKNNKFVW